MSNRTALWRRVADVAAHEMRGWKHDPLALNILLIVPFLYFILFGFVYQAGILRDIPIVICDQDRSAMSRSLVQALDAQERVKVATRVDTIEQVERLIRNGQMKGAVVIPPNFAESISQGQPQPALVVLDASNLIYAFNLRMGMVNVMRSYQADATMKLMAARGILPQQMLPVLQAIAFRDESWYNPYFNYCNYIMFGTMVMALNQVPLLVICLSISRERERRTWKQLLSGEGTAAVLMGKMLPYLLIMLAETGLLLILAHYWLVMPFRGAVSILFLAFTLFLIAALAMGLLLSTICRDGIEASSYVMLIGLPLFTIGGYTWPHFLMPLPLKLLSYTLPTTWILAVVRSVIVKGGGMDLAAPYCLNLAAIALVTIILVLILWQREAKQGCRQGDDSSACNFNGQSLEISQ